MSEPADPVRERYSLTAEDAATALAKTVARAQIASIENTAASRLDRGVDGFDRWSMRILFAGAPLAVGIYLLVATSWHQFGLGAVGLSVVVYFLVVAYQRVERRVDRMIDGAVDPRIADSSRGALKKAIETGRAEVLHGNAKAELSDHTLWVQAGGRTFTLADVRSAWSAEAGPHLVLGPTAPDLRAEVDGYVVLPARGAVASAIRIARAEAS